MCGAACDVTDPGQLQTLWDAAVEAFGGVDVWVNNAGVSIERLPLWEQRRPATWPPWSTPTSPGRCWPARPPSPTCFSKGHGQIWNTEGFGSDGATQPGMAAYGSTKRAVRYLQRALRKDTAGTRVQVCTVSPGIVVTELLTGDYDITSEQFEKAKRIFNILADDVHTVTPWLADHMLVADKSGAQGGVADPPQGVRPVHDRPVPHPRPVRPT